MKKQRAPTADAAQTSKAGEAEPVSIPADVWQRVRALAALGDQVEQGRYTHADAHMQTLEELDKARAELATQGQELATCRARLAEAEAALNAQQGPTLDKQHAHQPPADLVPSEEVQQLLRLLAQQPSGPGAHYVAALRRPTPRR